MVIMTYLNTIIEIRNNGGVNSQSKEAWPRKNSWMLSLTSLVNSSNLFRKLATVPHAFVFLTIIAFLCALDSKEQCWKVDWHTQKKTWSHSVARSTCWGLRIALLVRNEQRWKPHADVLYIYAIKGIGKTTNTKEGCIKYIPWGVPAALFLTRSLEVAKFIDRQNQSVQLRLFMYMCHDPPLPIGAFSKSMTMQN